MFYIRYFFIVDFIFLWMKGSFWGDCIIVENVMLLRKVLLKDYDLYLCLRRLQEDFVIINVSFGVSCLYDFNEKEWKIFILGYFRLIWIDEFLVWDKDKY